MNCPRCGIEAPADATRCAGCGFDLLQELPEEQETVVSAPPSPPAAPPGETGWSVPPDAAAGLFGQTSLPAGMVLGGRYRIDRALGVGGMGAVYAAWDNELERAVALKLIRPDLAGSIAVLQRFKQEIVLSREVTHPNVVRIFDLGTADGLKYITMELVPGRDLKGLIEERQGLGFGAETVSLMEQIARGLAAAHAAGVVHRDLKPQNVLVTPEGQAKVMDFGIARSLDVTGMTRTGEMIGTPAYMSPEQARGERVDARSDLFSLGIIFYEMITGQLPFVADSPMAALLKRIHEPAPSPRKLVADLPEWLNGVVMRCLERDTALRYSSAVELVADLEAHRAPPTPTLFDRVPSRLRAMTPGGRRAAILALLAVVALAAAVAVVTWRRPGAAPAQAQEQAAVEQIGLAILPFRNAAADPALDWLGASLPEMLRTDIGQSAALRTVPTDRVAQILADLRVAPNANLDAATLDRVANFTEARNLLSGQMVRVGEVIRIDATLHDLDRGRTTPIKVEARNEDEVLDAVSRLAAAVRDNLAVDARTQQELAATAFVPSTKSIEALQAYNEGLAHDRNADYPAALESYRAATRADGGFALAYAGLAQACSRLGLDEEAEEAARRATELATELPPFEQRQIAARHAAVTQSPATAIQAYADLVAAAPQDLDLRLALAELDEQTGDFDAAREQLDVVLKRQPDGIEGLLLLGRVAARGGDPQAALEPLQHALERATAVGSADGRGRALNGLGFAYQRMNRADEARQSYEQALALYRASGQKAGIAQSLANLAQVRAFQGDLDGAESAGEEALALRREIGDRSGIGDSLLNLGNFWANRGEAGKAIDYYKESLQIQRDVGNDVYAALCLNNIGSAYYDLGQYSDALTYYEQALAQRQERGGPADLGESLHNIGETELLLGRYDEALDYLLRAIEQWRAIGNDWGIAAESYDIGIIRGFQGSLGAALEAEREALDIFERLGSRDVWRFSALGQHGIALAELGRFDEAARALDEAVALARELRNGGLVAQAEEWQGRLHALQGDRAAARKRFQSSLSSATAAGDARAELAARLRLAVLTAEEAPTAQAAETLRDLGQRAQRSGLAYAALEAALARGAALLALGDADTARREAQTVQRTAERYTLKPLQARSALLLGRIAAAGGDDGERERYFKQGRAVLAEIRSSAGDDDPLRRTDLRELQAALGG